jgi:hypothetical protein
VTRFILAVYLSRIILRIGKPTTRSKKANVWVSNSLSVARRRLGGARSSIPEARLRTWADATEAPDLPALARPSIRGRGSHVVTPMAR